MDVGAQDEDHVEHEAVCFLAVASAHCALTHRQHRMANKKVVV